MLREIVASLLPGITEHLVARSLRREAEAKAGKYHKIAIGPYEWTIHRSSLGTSVTFTRDAPTSTVARDHDRIHRAAEAKDRVIVLGFDSGDGTLVDPGETRRVTSRPQDAFAPRTITIPKALAKHFDIIDIRIGAVSQFSSADPIPADTFAQDVESREVRMDTAQISQDVLFVVKNKSKRPRRFQATINGFVVRV